MVGDQVDWGESAIVVRGVAGAMGRFLELNQKQSVALRLTEKELLRK